MTPHESRDILASIVATWPNPLMPDIVMEAWIEELAPLNHAAARAAVKALIKTHTYRPTPAELVDLAAPDPGSAKAWVRLCRALGSHPRGGVALECAAVGVTRGTHALALVGVRAVEAVGFGGACGAAVGCAAWAAGASADGVAGEDAEALGWGEASALAGLCRPGHRWTQISAGRSSAASPGADVAARSR